MNAGGLIVGIGVFFFGISIGIFIDICISEYRRKNFADNTKPFFTVPSGTKSVSLEMIGGGGGGVGSGVSIPDLPGGAQMKISLENSQPIHESTGDRATADIRDSGSVTETKVSRKSFSEAEYQRGRDDALRQINEVLNS